ncbi:MAG TPA: hypothetical protein VJJ83_04945, partial [Candidatus Babeliales bacterium]|nr:hypothetical protein [Candidatus Babeliales bacterium]
SGLLACEQGCLKAAQAIGWFKPSCPDQRPAVATSLSTTPASTPKDATGAKFNADAPVASASSDSPVLTTADRLNPVQPTTAAVPLAPVETTKSATEQLKQAFSTLQNAYYQADLSTVQQQITRLKQLVTGQQLYLKYQPAKFYRDLKLPAKELLALNEYDLLSNYLIIASTPTAIIGLSASEHALLDRLLAGQIRAHEQTISDLLAQVKLPENSAEAEQINLKSRLNQQYKIINQQCRLWCQLANAGATSFTGQFLYTALKQQVISAVKYSFTHEGNTSMLYAYALIWLERLDQEVPHFTCAPAILNYLVRMTKAAKVHAAIAQLNLTKQERQRLIALDQHYRHLVTQSDPALTPSPTNPTTADLPVCSSPGLQSTSSPERLSPTELELERVSPLTQCSPTPAPSRLKSAAEIQALIATALPQLLTSMATGSAYYTLDQVKRVALAPSGAKRPAQSVAPSGTQYRIGTVTYSC